MDRSDDWRGAVVGDSWTEPDCGERVPAPVKKMQQMMMSLRPSDRKANHLAHVLMRLTRGKLAGVLRCH